MKVDLIEQYAIGAAKLRPAIAGLTPDDLLAAPIPGKWSTQFVLIHLADAEAAFADRIKRLIAMDDPVLLAWDENAFTQTLFYNEQSAEDALILIETTRRQLTRVLRALPPEAFLKSGLHSERGRQTIETVLTYAVNHLEHHLKFVAEKRSKLGK